MLYPTLWAYGTVVKTATEFSPYHLVHGVDSILLIECEIPSLKLSMEILPETSALEENLVHLEQLDEQFSIRGNLGSKMGLIRKRAKITFCELEFKNQ